MFCSKSTKGFPWPKIWARAPYCVWQKDFSLAQGTFSAFLYSIYDPVFPPGLDRHSHRNIFQASNTTWFHSLFFFCCFFFFFFSFWYILPCADPQTPDVEYHSTQDPILILPGTAQGNFSAKPCLVLFPLAFVYGWFIYVVISLVQYQFYRK